MDEIENKISKLVFGLSGEEVVEIGVGLVARGIYRTSQTHSSKEAAGVASSVSSVISSIHLDMLRAANNPPPPEDTTK